VKSLREMGFYGVVEGHSAKGRSGDARAVNIPVVAPESMLNRAMPWIADDEASWCQEDDASEVAARAKSVRPMRRASAALRRRARARHV